MIKDQYRIDLNPRIGEYDEVKIIADKNAYILPGSLGGIKNNPFDEPEVFTSDSSYFARYQTIGQKTAISTSFTFNEEEIGLNIDYFDPVIVLENGLLGRTINHKALEIVSENGRYLAEVSLVRRLSDGDTYLMRAVKASYHIGMPVYAIQTKNGIYIAPKDVVVEGHQTGMFIGWAMENYDVTDEGYDEWDDSTSNYPTSKPFESMLVNLVKVRVGKRLTSKVELETPMNVMRINVPTQTSASDKTMTEKTIEALDEKYGSRSVSGTEVTVIYQLDNNDESLAKYILLDGVWYLQTGTDDFYLKVSETTKTVHHFSSPFVQVEVYQKNDTNGWTPVAVGLDVTEEQDDDGYYIINIESLEQGTKEYRVVVQN